MQHITIKKWDKYLRLAREHGFSPQSVHPWSSSQSYATEFYSSGRFTVAINLDHRAPFGPLVCPFAVEIYYDSELLSHKNKAKDCQTFRDALETALRWKKTGGSDVLCDVFE